MEAFRSHWKNGKVAGFQSPSPIFTETAHFSPLLSIGLSLRIDLKIRCCQLGWKRGRKKEGKKGRREGGKKGGREAYWMAALDI